MLDLLRATHEGLTINPIAVWVTHKLSFNDFHATKSRSARQVGDTHPSESWDYTIAAYQQSSSVVPMVKINAYLFVAASK